MAQHRTILRHFLIINMVRQPGFPSLRTIMEMLEEHDFDIGIRTLQRDIENIRKEFGIEIRYNSYHKGYDINYEESANVDSLLKFLEMAALSGSFNELFTDTSQVKEFVSFEGEEAVKGVEFISKILFALKNSRELKITYKRYYDAKSYDVSIKPGLLKEYQNRWYVIGIQVGKDATKAYALDRMVDLQVGERTFDGAETSGIKEHFRHVIGISASDQQAQLVELTFTTEQAPYIETLPWHSSQEVVSRDDNETVFSLYVVPNYELIQKILSEGDHIKEIKPDELRQKVEGRK